MASTTSKPAPKANGSDSKPKPQAKGSGGKPKADAKPKPPKYGEVAKRVSDRARKMSCPQSLQGPIPKQSHDVMVTLTEGPREAIKSVGLSQAQLKAIATGQEDAKDVRKLARSPSACGPTAAPRSGPGASIWPRHWRGGSRRTESCDRARRGRGRLRARGLPGGPA